MMRALADLSVELNLHSYGDYGVYEWHECETPFSELMVTRAGRMVINRNQICRDHGGFGFKKDLCFLCDAEFDVEFIDK